MRAMTGSRFGGAPGCEASCSRGSGVGRCASRTNPLGLGAGLGGQPELLDLLVGLDGRVLARRRLLAQLLDRARIRGDLLDLDQRWLRAGTRALGTHHGSARIAGQGLRGAARRLRVGRVGLALLRGGSGSRVRVRAEPSPRLRGRRRLALPTDPSCRLAARTNYKPSPIDQPSPQFTPASTVPRFSTTPHSAPRWCQGAPPGDRRTRPKAGHSPHESVPEGRSGGRQE